MTAATREVELTRFMLRRLARGIHQHQAAGGHFLEEQAIGIDQEAMPLPRHAHREMGEDEIRHPEMRGGAVAPGSQHPDRVGIVDCERPGLWAYYYVLPDALKELSAWLS